MSRWVVRAGGDPILDGNVGPGAASSLQAHLGRVEIAQDSDQTL